MLNGMKREFFVLAMTSLLGLSLTGCSLNDGAQNGEAGGSSGGQASAQPTASPHSDMSKMKMLEKPASSPKKEMAQSSGPGPNQIVMGNFSFQPGTLTIKAGTKVTWINRDDVPHTAVDTDKRFNSKTLDTDDQFSFTFKEPGTYNYFCALHPKMTGQIIVK